MKQDMVKDLEVLQNNDRVVCFYIIHNNQGIVGKIVHIGIDYVKIQRTNASKSKVRIALDFITHYDVWTGYIE